MGDNVCREGSWRVLSVEMTVFSTPGDPYVFNIFHEGQKETIVV